MEKIDTTKIMGHYQNYENNKLVSGGDKTIYSIKMVAEKVNEIVEWINDHKDQLLN